MSVVDKIQHYQRNIVKCSDNVERMMHCISKLYSLPVTVQHLQETGVGRTVNALRKYDGDVGEAAKALVAKWKTMVADEESSEGDYEDEGCALDPPEDNDENSDSPKIDMGDEKELGHSSHESKQRHSNKSDKHKSSKQSSKNSSTDSSKIKDKSHSSSGSDRHKHSKADKEKREHKHESKNEKKSKKYRDSKNEKHRSRSDESGRDVAKVSNSNVSSKNEEDVHRKRRLDSSSSERESSKKRKASETELADHDTPSSLAEDNGNDILPSLSDESNSEEEEMPNAEIKQEPPSPPTKSRELAEKNEEKSERKSSKEKSKDSSSKSRSLSLSEKSKRDEDKDKKKNNKLEDNRKSEKRKDESYRSSKEISKSKSHPSSSSSKDKIRDKEKEKEKEKEKDKEDKHKEKHKAKESKHGKDSKDAKANFKEPKEKKKIKQEINGDEGIDCNSGASFAEALGMCTMPLPSRKRNNNSPNPSPTKVIKTEPSTSSSSSSSVINKPPTKIKTEAPPVTDPHQPSLLAPNVKLEPLSVDLASTLPEISPNYKPLPYINPIHRKQEEDRALSEVIYAKNQRTKVYSGNKSGYTNVPSLYEMCIRILIENIEALEFTGGVPYDIIKPVLERATPDQLFMLEHHNPYLIEDTDPLWQFHCNREFRCKQREEMETWREMYMRCLDEREAKLKALTANIKQSIDKSLPVRSAKLAYVDNVVKPPRHVLRKQAKYGTATATPSSTSDLKKKLIAGGGSNAATNISVPPPPMSRSKTSSSGMVKKTKAPLMAKALQLIKGRYKR